MSSTRYSAALMPDPKLRRLVLGIGALTSLWGIVAIWAMGIPWSARTALAVSWGLVSSRNLVLIAQRYKACCRIQLDASGQLQVFGADGRCTIATLEPGSVVLQWAAWLRFRTGEGMCHAELLGRKSAGGHEWRRFQVIWRHLGATV